MSKVHLLNPKKVQSLSEPKMYNDGGGLYLRITENGKYWVHRITVNKKRTDKSLGPVDLLTLKEARERVRVRRKAIKNGGNPEAVISATGIPTFNELAKKVHKTQSAGFKCPKHKKQWISTIEEYATPVIGNRLVSQITVADMLAIFEPIWITKHETARRTIQRISKVFDYALAMRWVEFDPALTARPLLPKIKKRKVHRKALPYSEVGESLNIIHDTDAKDATILALDLLIHTATRSGEIRQATWDEVDLAGKLWTIPAARMKMAREHKIPLSPRAVEILKSARRLSDSTGLIFHGMKKTTALSDSTMSKLIRENGIQCVPHGYRSSFRDWATEQTDFAFEVGEFALAHVISDAAAAAYARSTMLDKRRALMDQWSEYIMAA